MAQGDLIFIARSAIGESEFIMDFLEKNIPTYKLSEMTNGDSPNTPAIHATHPLTMVLGNAADSEGDESTTLLPSIGVELINDTESPNQTLGRGGIQFVIDQAYIDELKAIPIEDRIKSGTPIADSTIADIQTELDLKTAANLKLYALRHVDFHQQSINVAAWATNITTKDVVYKIVRILLKRMRFVVSKLGVRNMKVNGTDNFYNYDFAQTLFGGEFAIEWQQPVTDVIIDPAATKLIDVELFNKAVPENRDVTGITPVTKTIVKETVTND